MNKFDTIYESILEEGKLKLPSKYKKSIGGISLPVSENSRNYNLDKYKVRVFRKWHKILSAIGSSISQSDYDKILNKLDWEITQGYGVHYSKKDLHELNQLDKIPTEILVSIISTWGVNSFEDVRRAIYDAPKFSYYKGKD